ncbi:sulfurtransferase [Gryllotalpicola ginsengisoli]|uniref:sulfurtransferase n=1 Tax=Gryllotalpicola ginsengisoli TaxID=444608 RepID=UPI0003B437AB|nr:sulfurtransferase [Gryllotalpicola ginsengisoli]
MSTTPILTDPDELAEAIKAGRYPDGGPLRLLDVRWRLDRPNGRAEFERGHIPGALYVDLETELAAPPADRRPEDGRHPLPAIDDLETVVRSWGVDEGDTVVVYDDLKNLSAARAWWLLRYAGVRDVRLLDGALRAWKNAGGAVETGPGDAPVPGTITLRYGALPALSLDEVPEFAASAPLLDARAAERYRGETEPVDPRAGHVPGAISAPTTANVDAEGRFLTPGELRARFEDLGLTDASAVGVYCGSGVTAAHEAVALALAGYEPRLFPGSWSQWSNHPELPVATGD